ncbi:hypothetical protein MicB006_5615 [Micromonospora sp. B006]|nr:hypothetical protein MicB006_5615 [Micromonospora sp. B006]
MSPRKHDLDGPHQCVTVDGTPVDHMDSGNRQSDQTWSFR